MESLSRVVWEEGMYLGPQHFQAQNRYFEDSIQFVSAALGFEPYGFSGCAVDPNALSNGTVSVLHARGIFPDGLAFHAPDNDPLPPARQIGDAFGPTASRFAVHLAIPSRRPGGCNVALTPNGTETRYLAESCSLRDETTGADERTVRLGRKNLRLLFENELQEGWTSLPVASVVRDGAGGYRFDPEFVPPCVQISASERLMVLLHGIVDILAEKSATLADAAASGQPADYSPRDLAAFWLLHSVNSALAALEHIRSSRRGHPEGAYLELLRLGGALCTFGVGAHPRDLPLYDHHNLGECFRALDKHIRAHLEIVLPTRCVPIPLRKHDECFWEGEISDARCFDSSGWVLGLRAGAGAADIITKTPQLVKVCSAKFIRELVRRAMAGLALHHLPSPPAAVRPNVEAQYFGIARTGPFWENILETGRIGVYVPGDLPGAEIELFAVLKD